MLSIFHLSDTNRQLYFNLNSSIQLLDPPMSSKYKIPGLYSIYKNNICLYVGQSGHLPSRISDHITGRYCDFDFIRLYFVDVDGFSDFFERPEDCQRQILENNEAELLSILKPIENLAFDRDSKRHENLLFDGLNDEAYNATIYKYYSYLTVLEYGGQFQELISPLAIREDNQLNEDLPVCHAQEI